MDRTKQTSGNFGQQHHCLPPTGEWSGRMNASAIENFPQGPSHRTQVDGWVANGFARNMNCLAWGCRMLPSWPYIWHRSPPSRRVFQPPKDIWPALGFPPWTSKFNTLLLYLLLHSTMALDQHTFPPPPQYHGTRPTHIPSSSTVPWHSTNTQSLLLHSTMALNQHTFPPPPQHHGTRPTHIPSSSSTVPWHSTNTHSLLLHSTMALDQHTFPPPPQYHGTRPTHIPSSSTVPWHSTNTHSLLLHSTMALDQHTFPPPPQYHGTRPTHIPSSSTVPWHSTNTHSQWPWAHQFCLHPAMVLIVTPSNVLMLVPSQCWRGMRNIWSLIVMAK